MICRTPEEAFRAGQEDGESDAPLTQQEIEHLSVLHSPYLNTIAMGEVG